MTKVDSYASYQKQYYEQKVAGKQDSTDKTGQAKKTNTVDKTETKQVSLSEDAKNLLAELKKKYGNMDFFIADYETEEEAQSYLSRGTKEYSVLISPEQLEEMAADESVKEKYTTLIEDATSQIAEAKEQLGDDAENVKSIGITIDKDGTVSFFAQLEKVSERQRENIEKLREDKRTETKETSVYAKSITELIDKIREIDWSSISSEEKSVAGNRIDYSV